MSKTEDPRISRPPSISVPLIWANWSRAYCCILCT